MSVRDQSAEQRDPVFCSIIIPTIGRDCLTRAVRSVLDQTLTAALFEVIVVNDSGRPLPAADWHDSPKVRILATNRRERSVARNAGAALAKGAYLGFLDDDDWLLPDALTHYWSLARQWPNAVWLYGAIRVVDSATGACLAEVNSGLNGNCFAQVVGGAWAPIQTSILRRETFFEVGGYDPGTLVTEDLDLCRRIAYLGDFANTPEPIGCLSRGDQWETSSDYSRAHAATLRSRNQVLSEPRAFSRLLESAGSAYWSGRVVRVCLSTMKWNWQRRLRTTALRHALLAALAAMHSGRRLFATGFWRGLRADHVPDSLHFILKALEETPRASD